jgi:hypothetical protein
MPPGTQRSSLAPPDDLKRDVQAAFDPGEAQPKYRSGFGRYDGLAYIGAEAYFHLAGAYDSGLRPMQLKYRGKSHWWLVDPENRVIDMVLGARETSKFPYHRGKRRPFRYTPAGISRAAQKLVDRVRETRTTPAA